MTDFEILHKSSTDAGTDLGAGFPQWARVVELRTQLSRLGWAVVPVVEESKGPQFAGWPNYTYDPANPEPEIPRTLNAKGVPTRIAHRGTGVRTIGIVGVDFDIDTPDLAHAARATFEEACGERSPVVRCRSGSPRCMLLYRAADGMAPLSLSRGGEAGKIEIFANHGGRQVFVHGRHPSGQLLEYEGDGPEAWPVAELPQLDEATVRVAYAAALKAAGIPFAEPQRGGEERPCYDGEKVPDAELWRQLISGDSLHEPIRDLSARLVGRGMARDGVLATLQGAMESTPEFKRDQRWRDRYVDIPRAVDSAIRKYTQAPDPIPLGDDLPAVHSLDPELLPEAFRPWLRDIADRMQAVLDLPAAAAMVGAGAAIGRRCGIKPQQHTDWIEAPNIWGALVGRPAMMKSPLLSAVLGPMKKLEAEAAAANESALSTHDLILREFEFRQKVASEAAKKALKAGKQADLSFMEEEPPQKPRLTRYILNDATYEKAGEVMADNPAGILVERDEIVGFLKPLDRDEQAAARAFWLQAWNGRDGYTFDRVIRGTVRIPACCASVIGGIQPGKLARYLRAAVRGGAGDDGLMQRFGVLVWPDQSGEWRNVDRCPDMEAKRRAQEVFRQFVALDPATIGAAQGEFDPIPTLRFSREGLRCFEEFREGLERRLRSGDLHPALESHLAKYRKLVPALALISHLADHPEGGPVSAEAALRAIAWAEYLETHAYRAYAAVALPERAAARSIWRRLKSGDVTSPFAARDIQRKGWTGLSTGEDVRGGLDVLIAHNHVFAEHLPGAVTGGRPAEQFRVNPKALAL